jgi:hypothetical protein
MRMTTAGQDALLTAVRDARPEIAAMLIAAGAPLHQADVTGCTALLAAVIARMPEVVALMIHARAGVPEHLCPCASARAHLHRRLQLRADVPAHARIATDGRRRVGRVPFIDAHAHLAPDRTGAIIRESDRNRNRSARRR